MLKILRHFGEQILQQFRARPIRTSLTAILIFLVLQFCYGIRPIGKFTDPERERIVMNNGDVYIHSSGPYGGGDIGLILGSAYDNSHHFIFSIRGEFFSRDYIYAAGFGHGKVFERVRSCGE